MTQEKHARRTKPKPSVPPAIREARHAKDLLDEEEAKEELKKWTPKRKKL
jgi:hypothetical protein